MRKLVIAGLVGGAIVAGGRYHLTREPSSAELFEQANPRPGSGERQVAIAFYRRSEMTELVFTFRPMPTP